MFLFYKYTSYVAKALADVIKIDDNRAPRLNQILIKKTCATVFIVFITYVVPLFFHSSKNLQISRLIDVNSKNPQVLILNLIKYT